MRATNPIPKVRDHSHTMTQPETPAHYTDLDAALETAWDILAEGAGNRRVPTHTPTLATIGTDGAPRMRTVVLRGFETASRQVRFHTDRRSGKINELRADPRAGLHVYDPQRKVQLQIDGRVHLHMDDPLANQAWQQTQPMSRIVYQVTRAPGTVIDSPLDVTHDNMPDAGLNDGGSENFLVATLQVETLEWLFLDARGHRRARFTREGNAWSGTWLVP